MKTVKENKFLTIKCTGEEVYFIGYSTGSVVDIANYTDNSIYLSTEDDFSESEDMCNYAELNSGDCYNGVHIFSGIYIKSLGSGSITIIRCY